MNEKLLKEVLSDSKFAELLIQQETPEDVQILLKEKGIELTLEDITSVRNILEQQAEGELSEDNLENVSGGSLTLAAAIGIASIISASSAALVSIGDKVNTWTNRRW